MDPKYIDNKVEAKGLQKLCLFCQMCKEQCRNENGFKCHTMSESHQRQLLLFAENPGRFMNEFSRQFEHEFLELFKPIKKRKLQCGHSHTDILMKFKLIEKQTEVGKKSANAASTSESVPTELKKVEDEKMSLKLNLLPIKKRKIRYEENHFL